MIKSEPTKGLIYAGDTPLASTIVIEQTGPWQLTVHPGIFTTTGQAQIIHASEVNDFNTARALLKFVDEEKAELIDPTKMRVWLQDEAGQPVSRAKTHELKDSLEFNFEPDKDVVKYYVVELGEMDGQPQIIVRSFMADEGDFPIIPGWELMHALTLIFAIAPDDKELPDIYVITVQPGFPIVSTDWRKQVGILR